MAHFLQEKWIRQRKKSRVTSIGGFASGPGEVSDILHSRLFTFYCKVIIAFPSIKKSVQSTVPFEYENIVDIIATG